MYNNHNLKITIYDLTLFEFDKKTIIYFEKTSLERIHHVQLKTKTQFQITPTLMFCKQALLSEVEY